MLVEALYYGDAVDSMASKSVQITSGQEESSNLRNGGRGGGNSDVAKCLDPPGEDGGGGEKGSGVSAFFGLLRMPFLMGSFLVGISKPTLSGS